MVRYLQRLDEIAPAGYTVGVHIRFASPLYLKSTYPQAWQDIYAANAYSLRDPLVFWGISKSGKIRWSEITLPDPFGIMKKAGQHGLTYGAVVACGKITSRTIVGAARSDREFTDTELSDIEEVALGLHDVTEPPEDLTPAMIEALRLVGDGYRHTAAAAELGISESALKARLSSARHKLGARTTAEALRMAREYRLL
ncbi:autoinducer binding domain-containing protein [Jannaschia sp. 2305UL9-9]|uniref:helix-turn-helix transcriptional regulator n=1 Tax=Jannaschia sp. 2305UL9-9 TaxID=3121638 RepID=UPI0035288673